MVYVYANLLGNEAGRAIYDGDTLIASCGELIASGRRFGFGAYELTCAVVDLDQARTRGSWTASTSSPLLESPNARVAVPFQFPTVKPVRSEPPPAIISTNTKEEEFSRAVALGLFDYMRKSRSSGFVVSLSGGADSAAVACLVGMMARWALRELGSAVLCEKLPGLRERGSGIRDERALTAALLTTVYQSTRNSSAATRRASREVAESLGAAHFEMDVDSLVEQYTHLAEVAVGRKLTWEEDDLALQNIQARVRAPSVWMLANIRGALLLSTSNRSEAAVGYATMDGDTAGGLSPIAGIDKAFLLSWLSWLEREGPSDLGPMPALSVVTQQSPTAELRPPGASQTDEKDLMPYVVLDRIERAAIRDKRSPAEVLSLLRAECPEHSLESLRTWVTRFFRLWSRNQWKRERYAPSFHVDDANLDPKTWCRFPILSGGFERELRELETR